MSIIDPAYKRKSNVETPDAVVEPQLLLTGIIH